MQNNERLVAVVAVAVVVFVIGTVISANYKQLNARTHTRMHMLTKAACYRSA